MTTRRILVPVLVCAVAVASARIAGAAGFTDPKCGSAKQKAAAKKEAGKLGCWAKAATKPPVDPACLTKAEVAFSTAFGKADAKGACTGDAPTLEAEVDGCVNKLAASDTPDIPVQTGLEKCGAAKMKAAGKAAAAQLGCWAKATGKGGFCSVSVKVKCEKDSDCPSGETCNQTAVDQACLDKASNNLTVAFGKADAKGACPGDPVAVGADVSASCVTPIKNNLPGLPPGCGNHVVEPQFDETCDDGNTQNGDGCPASCHVDSCTPTATTLATSVTYVGPGGVNIQGLAIFVDYPEGKVGSVTFGPTVFGVGSTNVDLGYGFNATPVKNSGALPSPFLHVSYKTCSGAPAASASDFHCTVTDASDDQGNAVPADQVTCTVTIP